MRFEEFWVWLTLRADKIDQALVGLIALGIVMALVAAMVPARKREPEKGQSVD
jgi:hypothetical protein